MSRKNTDYVKEIILKNPLLIDELFDFVILNEEPLSRRAIWALDLISETNPALIKPYIEILIEHFPNFQHDGLKRHSLRILSRFEIPENKEVEVLEICFRFLHSEKESIAARFFAMEILYKLSEKEKDLKNELIAVLEYLPTQKSAGLSNHILKLLEKLKNEISKI